MSGNITLLTTVLKAHYSVFSCFCEWYELRFLWSTCNNSFSTVDNVKTELGFQIYVKIERQCFSKYFFYMHGQVRKDTVGKCTDQHSNHFRYIFVIFSKRNASLWRVRFVWLLGCSVTRHLLSKLWVTRLKQQQQQWSSDDDWASDSVSEVNQVDIFRKLVADLWRHAVYLTVCSRYCRNFYTI